MVPRLAPNDAGDLRLRHAERVDEFVVCGATVASISDSQNCDGVDLSATVILATGLPVLLGLVAHIDERRGSEQVAVTHVRHAVASVGAYRFVTDAARHVTRVADVEANGHICTARKFPRNAMRKGCGVLTVGDLPAQDIPSVAQPARCRVGVSVDCSPEFLFDRAVARVAWPEATRLAPFVDRPDRFVALSAPARNKHRSAVSASHRLIVHRTLLQCGVAPPVARYDAGAFCCLNSIRKEAA